MIVRASVVLAVYEVLADSLHLPVISHWRGPLRWVMGAYVAWLAAHLVTEWTADDLGRAAAKAWL